MVVYTKLLAKSNEIFISGATVDDLDIIDAVTAERKASGKIITSTELVALVSQNPL